MITIGITISDDDCIRILAASRQEDPRQALGDVLRHLIDFLLSDIDEYLAGLGTWPGDRAAE